MVREEAGAASVDELPDVSKQEESVVGLCIVIECTALRGNGK